MFIQPDFLKPGDKIAIVAPARKVLPNEISEGIKYFENNGFEVILGKNLFEVNHQFAGTDEQRASDFQWALDDPQIKAIICARGGYGTSRIIEKLDFSKLKKQPKWIAGFSDNTTLHCHINNLGFQSIHSTVPLLMGSKNTKESDDSLVNLLVGNPSLITVPNCDKNQIGDCKATIVGGNLSLIVNMLGTTSELNTDDKILFIEDLDENLYHFDRMMVQLQRAKKLSKLKGLIIGHFSKIKDDKDYFGEDIIEIIERNAAEVHGPICYNYPSGHENPNIALYFGRLSKLKVDSKGSCIEYL